MPLVDLKAKPYYLKDEDIAWVESTIAAMTTEEKIGQLFINLFMDLDSTKTQELLNKYHIGGARYHGGDSETVYKLLSTLQRSVSTMHYAGF